MTKVLAVGGHAHGTMLPLPEPGHRLHTMAPVEWTMADLTTTNLEIPVAMPDVVEYQLVEYEMRWTGRQGQRAEHWPLLVVAGMDKTEAEAWVRLVVTWYIVWCMVAMAGVLPYITAMQSMATDISEAERRAWAWRELLRLRDELDDLLGD